MELGVINGTFEYANEIKGLSLNKEYVSVPHTYNFRRFEVVHESCFLSVCFYCMEKAVYIVHA